MTLHKLGVSTELSLGLLAFTSTFAASEFETPAFSCYGKQTIKQLTFCFISEYYEQTVGKTIYVCRKQEISEIHGASLGGVARTTITKHADVNVGTWPLCLGISANFILDEEV